MPLIQFPNIPSLPGVPQLTRAASNAVSSAVSAAIPIAAGALISKLPGGLLSGALMRALQTNFKWGVFDADGKALADPAEITGILGNVLDSFGIGAMLSTNSFDYAKETRVSDFPVEGGQFATYNKVELPGAATVTLAMSGNEAARQKFLTAIDDATKSLDLYSVVTPSATYINHVIERYSYQRRAERGAGLLIVELSLREVREVSAAYVNTLAAAEDDSGADTDAGEDEMGEPADEGATPAEDSGQVQPKEPEKSVLATAVEKINGFISSANSTINTAADKLKSSLNSAIKN